MGIITTCPECKCCYEEQSEEEANNPLRLCYSCYEEKSKHVPIVWVPHEVYNINILSANKFGDINIISNIQQIMFDVSLLKSKINSKMSKAKQGDFLLCIGDPLQIALCAIKLDKVTDGKFSILKWDKHTNQYYAVKIGE